MDRIDLKRRAINSLKHHYAPLVLSLITIILLGISSYFVGVIIYNVSLSSILDLLLLGLLSMGLIQIVVKTARNQKTSFKDFFSRTDLFFKALAISLGFFIFSMSFSLLEYISVTALDVFTTYQTDLNMFLSAFLILIGVILSLTIPLLYFMIIISFSQVYFILYDNNKMPITQIFKKSSDIMDEHKIDYIMIWVSFIPWIILGVLTFGLLYLWLIPYMLVTFANFYDEIKN